MKRYGDNLPNSTDEELENQPDKNIQFMRGNCAVRQDMVSFLMPADAPKKRKPLKIFSLFKAERKEELGG
ncbi:MAG: hypothetical protein ABI904_14730 [Chloroflexota bacterium]